MIVLTKKFAIKEAWMFNDNGNKVMLIPLNPNEAFAHAVDFNSIRGGAVKIDLANDWTYRGNKAIEQLKEAIKEKLLNGRVGE